MLLDQARGGDDDALSEVWTLVYNQLQIVARNLLRGDALENQLNATELIGEIYIRGQYDKDIPRNRQEYFGRAFRHMSQELIDRARETECCQTRWRVDKRPLEIVEGEFSSIQHFDAQQDAAAAVAMKAWQDLDKIFPEEATVAYFRMVLGLSNKDTAKVLERTPKQAEHQWYFARAKLREALEKAF